MPTITTRFGPDLLREALRETAKGHPSSKPMVYRDPSLVGVTIRVSGQTAAWYLKRNTTLKKLGDVGSPDVKSDSRQPDKIYTARDADALAKEVRRRVDLGLDTDAYLKARWAGCAHDDAEDLTASRRARADGAWTWTQLADAYIQEHVATETVTSRGRPRPPSQKTVRDVEAVLKHVDVIARIGNRLLREIGRVDFEAIRDKWADEGRTGAQRKFIIYARAALTWAKRHHAASGLADIIAWWPEVQFRRFATRGASIASVQAPPNAPLTPEQVGKLLFLAEKYRTIPGRRVKSVTSDITLAALWWVALTAQRTHASSTIRKDLILDRLSEDGWYEVSFLPVDMKSKRHFKLPITDEIYRRTIGRALASPSRREDSIWVFPSSRTKLRNKDATADIPVSDMILNCLLNRLRGRDDQGGLRSDGRDLLTEAGLPHFTLHSVREALATHLGAAKDVPPGAASAILDHAITAESAPWQQHEAAVTREYYNRAHKLELKIEGLRRWSDAVLASYQSAVRLERIRLCGPEPGGEYDVVAGFEQNPPPAGMEWLTDSHIPPASSRQRSSMDFGLLNRVSRAEQDAEMEFFARQSQPQAIAGGNGRRSRR